MSAPNITLQHMTTRQPDNTRQHPTAPDSTRQEPRQTDNPTWHMRQQTTALSKSDAPRLDQRRRRPLALSLRKSSSGRVFPGSRDGPLVEPSMVLSVWCGS